jgi:TetR/AcrR family transcriptional regulator, cholesterol catabolism regulator
MRLCHITRMPNLRLQFYLCRETCSTLKVGLTCRSVRAERSRSGEHGGEFGFSSAALRVILRDDQRQKGKHTMPTPSPGVIRQTEGKLPPPVESLTPRQLQRRQSIADAALALVAKSTENVEVRDVADKAGVALGTVYRYFGSKEALFAEVYLMWCQRSFDRFASRVVGESNADRLRSALHMTVDALARQPQFWHLGHATVSSRDPGVEACRHAVEQVGTALFAGTMAGLDEKDALGVAVVAMATLNTFVSQWIVGRLRIDEVYEAVDEAVRVALEFRDPSIGGEDGPSDAEPRRALTAS